MKRFLAIFVFNMAAWGLCLVAAEPPVDFVRQIKPILADRCVICHNSEALMGGLNLQSRELALRNRKEGPIITPGKPDHSPLYRALTLPPDAKKAMPATAHRLPKSEIEWVRQWIVEGAEWPSGKEGLIPHAQKKP